MTKTSKVSLVTGLAVAALFCLCAGRVIYNSWFYGPQIIDITWINNGKEVVEIKTALAKDSTVKPYLPFRFELIAKLAPASRKVDAKYNHPSFLEVYWVSSKIKIWREWTTVRPGGVGFGGFGIDVSVPGQLRIVRNVKKSPR